MNTFYKHIPNSVGAPAWEPIEFDTLDELVAHEHLSRWLDCFEDYTFEIDERTDINGNNLGWFLMVVTEEGFRWHVAGHVTDKLDLPQWKPRK
jgi:hypothetical protein